MDRGKRVCISSTAHRRLKLLAARRNRPMGRLVEELLAREAEELDNPWLSPAGLRIQEATLSTVWGDPEFEVYDEE